MHGPERSRVSRTAAGPLVHRNLSPRVSPAVWADEERAGAGLGRCRRAAFALRRQASAPLTGEAAWVGRVAERAQWPEADLASLTQTSGERGPGSTFRR